MSDLDLDLDRVRRRAVPLRIAFLHRPQARGGPGPLAEFVRSRRETALDLLLFAHAVSPLSAPDPIAASAADWAAAIQMTPRPGNRAMISRSWSWLEASGLVTSSPKGRIRTVEIRREDASGQPWVHPSEHREPYLQLPHEYWQGGFVRSLSLAAKAMLLIGISLQELTPTNAGKRFFEFPLERGAAWYGLTRESARIGLRDLREMGLLRTWVDRRDSAASPVGMTFDRRHSLNRLTAGTETEELGLHLPYDPDLDIPF